MAAILPRSQLSGLGAALHPAHADWFSLVFAFTRSADTVLVLPILLSIPLSAGFFFLHPYEEAAWAIFYRDITAAPSDTEEI